MPHLNHMPVLNELETTLFAAGLTEVVHALATAVLSTHRDADAIRLAFERNLEASFSMGDRENESAGTEAVRQVAQAVAMRLAAGKKTSL